MMLLLRLIKVLLTARRRGRLGPLDESVLRLRIWFNDLDLNAHLNNGRFLSLMDLGRMEVFLRLGAARLAARRRWRPLVGAATIRFRRPLPPLALFQLRTRLVGWDEKWFFFEQRFERAGDLAALAHVRFLVRGPAGNVAPAEVLAALGFDAQSPPLPEAVKAWSDWRPEA